MGYIKESVTSGSPAITVEYIRNVFVINSHEFIIPFDLVHLMFCHEHLEYFNALRN